MPSQPSEGLHWDMEAIAAVMPQRQQQHNNNNEPTTLSLHRNPSLAFRHPTMRPNRSQTPPPQNDDVSMQVDTPQSGDVTERDTSAEVRRDVTGRAEFANYAGGTMFELGCHIIDLVVGVLGTPDKVHAFPRHSASIDDACLDNMLSVFEYERATATVRSSINEVDGFARRHFTFCGTEGTIHIQPLDDPKAMIALNTERPGHGKRTHEQTFPKFTRYVADAEDLAKIVAGEKDADFSYEHDYHVQRAILLASGLPIV